MAIAHDEECVVVADDVFVQVVPQVAIEAGADIPVGRFQLDEQGFTQAAREIDASSDHCSRLRPAVEGSVSLSLRARPLFHPNR